MKKAIFVYRGEFFRGVATANWQAFPRFILNSAKRAIFISLFLILGFICLFAANCENSLDDINPDDLFDFDYTPKPKTKTKTPAYFDFSKIDRKAPSEYITKPSTKPWPKSIINKMFSDKTKYSLLQRDTFVEYMHSLYDSDKIIRTEQEMNEKHISTDGDIDVILDLMIIYINCKVFEYVRDFNNDGKVNCRDRTALFKAFWDTTFPQYKSYCHIIWVYTLNLEDNISHMFIGIRSPYDKTNMMVPVETDVTMALHYSPSVYWVDYDLVSENATVITKFDKYYKWVKDMKIPMKILQQ